MLSLRAPLQRGMTVLNRAAFTQTLPLAAGQIRDNRNIPKIRTTLKVSREIFDVPRMPSVQSHPDPGLATKGTKCFLLDPRIKLDEKQTWSPSLNTLVEEKELGLIPYSLTLDYEYWSYRDIMLAVLPEELHEDIPQGYSMVGHVAHLNLREQYWPYKKLIGEVIKDKQPNIETVINKLDDVGNASEYRTFQYEVLAGKNDLMVETHEADCTFRFNYAKVYWNPRLSTEHQRIVGKFQPGEAICDVMAGVGPFAVPAGKKGVFAWANDLNPTSCEALVKAISENKVQPFVTPFKSDGRAFIPYAIKDLLQKSREKRFISIPTKQVVKRSVPRKTVYEDIKIPPTFSHFVLNLPASALTFLDAFVGAYHGLEKLFEPHNKTQLPMIHVYCFASKSDDNVREMKQVFEEISNRIGYTVGALDGDTPVEFHDVRDVAPNKRMFCASFRLPAEVAFRAMGTSHTKAI